MTKTIIEFRKNIESELYDLMYSAKLGIRKIWFGEINPADIQTPSVHFMLPKRNRNDMQVMQTNNQIAWNLEYDVSCMYSGIEGDQTHDNAYDFVDNVYDTIQGQHSATGRLNNECHDIWCESVEYGIVALGIDEPIFTTGGVIKMIIEIFEVR